MTTGTPSSADLLISAQSERTAGLLALALQHGDLAQRLQAEVPQDFLAPEYHTITAALYGRTWDAHDSPLTAINTANPDAASVATDLVLADPSIHEKREQFFDRHLSELRRIHVVRQMRGEIETAESDCRGCGPDEIAARAAALVARLEEIEATGAALGRKCLTLAGDILTNPPPPRRWIFGGVIADDSLWAICAAGGTGKTRLMLDIAIAWAIGRDSWGGLFLPGAKLRTLFVSPESSLHRIHDDLQRMTADLSDDERAAVTKGIAYFTPPHRVTDYTAAATLRSITRTAREHAADVIVFDPLNEFSAGDLNNDADMRETIDRMTDAAWRGREHASVGIVHHARTGRKSVAGAFGWDRADFGRNSKALYAAVRCQLNASAMDAEGREGIVLACGKSNDAPPFSARGLRLDEHTLRYRFDPLFDVDGWQRAVASGKATGMHSAKVRELIEAEPGITTREIARRLDLNAGTVSKARRGLGL